MEKPQSPFTKTDKNLYIPYFNYLESLFLIQRFYFSPIIASVHTLYYIPKKKVGFVYSNVPISLYLINLENYSLKPL